jgi:hypothetical protein
MHGLFYSVDQSKNIAKNLENTNHQTKPKAKPESQRFINRLFWVI